MNLALKSPNTGIIDVPSILIINNDRMWKYWF